MGDIMTIRHLKILIAVCENGSITKAAEMLHIAQPAVSCTIAEIEKYCLIVSISGLLLQMPEKIFCSRPAR